MAGTLRQIGLRTKALLPASSPRVSCRAFAWPAGTYAPMQNLGGRRHFKVDAFTYGPGGQVHSKIDVLDVKASDREIEFKVEAFVYPRLHRHRLPNIWLRDNCRCPSCVDQYTMQKNVNVFSMPPDIHALDVNFDVDGLNVTWSDGEHKSTYSWEFILNYLRLRSQFTQILIYPWGAGIASGPPTIPYEQVMDSSDEEGMAKLTSLIVQFGFAFVDDTPCGDGTATKKLLERIAFIRETHYGGFYDFTPNRAMADTAYTNKALPAHTDTTYFTDPAGLQAFHLLRHQPPRGSPESARVFGGKSLLVDGFHAAYVLYKEDEPAFELLCNHSVNWHASGNRGITIGPHRRFPVLEKDSQDDLERRKFSNVDVSAQPGIPNGGVSVPVTRVRWNNDDRGVVPVFDRVGKWYDAARKWESILRRKEMEYWFQLRPGRTLIFDNYRVLHGRSAFNGIRRICGGYINRDDFMSRWRTTNFSPDAAMAQVVG